MSRSRSQARSSLITVAAIIAAVLALAGLYLVRSGGDTETGSVTAAGTGTVDDIPVSPLLPDPEAGAPTGAPVPEGDDTVDPDNPPTPGPEQTPAAQATPGANPTQEPTPTQTDLGANPRVHVLWMDGWSLKALGTPAIRAVDSVTGRAATVKFSPLTDTQIRATLKTDPQVIAAYLARLVTSASKVTCTADGCTADGDPVDLAVLSNLGTADGLGPMYTGAKIDAGLWAARVAAPAGSSAIVLEAGPSGEYVLGELTADTAGTTEAAPAPANGYLKRSWPLAYGLGRLFALEPAWADPVKPGSPRWTASVATVDQKALTADGVGPLFIGGLGDTSFSNGLSTLTDSQMTYLTSPTTGCGPIVLCVPETLTAKVSDVQNNAAEVCYEGKTTGTPAGQAVLLSQRMKINVTLPYPANLFGLGTAGAPSSADVLGYRIGTATKLSSGDVTFNQQSILLLDDRGLVAAAGSRNNSPVALNDKRLFGGKFTACTPNVASPGPTLINP